ncbi:MAG: hypothetical protein SWJ54_01975 [Cyanobacteriota bacterium]|nr:hypothetical protein [Cyanobacteriota bacterium]
MKKIYTAFIGLALSSILISFSLSAEADTTKVRCDFYPKGEDQASDYGICTFSQRQGYISIQKEDGTRYEFSPVGDEPGNFVDQSGEPVYRQSGLGDEGVIFRLPAESIFIYWNASQSGDNQNSSGSAYTPTTYTTVQNSREIAIQITEGEFQFAGILKRGETGSFVGSDDQVEVIFNPQDGHVIVTNKTTGKEFYNYYTDPIPTFEDPNTMCNPAEEPC